MRYRLLLCILCLWIVLFAGFDSAVPKDYHVQYNQQIITYPGATVTLTCAIQNFNVSVRWLLNGELQDENKRYLSLFNISSGKHLLQIDNVLLEDDGVWHCQEFDDHESLILTSKAIRLIVAVAPQKPFIVFEDRKLADEATFTIKEKNTVTFICIVENANPAPSKLNWILGTENITGRSHLIEDYSETEHVYHTRKTVTLEITRAHHRLPLQCEVHHLGLTAPISVSLLFNILYSPSFVISRIPGFGFPIRESIAVSLHCAIDANPSSKPIWIKDDGPPLAIEANDGFLNFSAISRENAGWYRCSTQHDFGNFASFGYFLNVRSDAPEIVVQPPPHVEVALGGKVKLECAAEGKPPPSYCWAKVKDGGNLESMALEENLLLDRILYSDAGVYKCIARNNIGLEEQRADSREVEVVVSGRPQVNTFNSSLMAVVGRPLTLSAQYCAHPEPLRSHWIIHSFILSPGQQNGRFTAHNVTPIDLAHCYRAVLDIKEVYREDAGEFLFLVKNIHGIDDVVVWLNITQASYSVSKASVCKLSSLYIGLTLLLLLYLMKAS